MKDIIEKDKHNAPKVIFPGNLPKSFENAEYPKVQAKINNKKEKE